MKPRFSLIDEPWITLRARDGIQHKAGLKKTLCQAHEFTALVEPSPPNLVALHRLLLAVLSRALGQEGVTWQPEKWWREGLPAQAVESYLERWRERFWVFHETHPFMQVAALRDAPETRDKKKPWTQLALGRANGDDPLVFDHMQDKNPTQVSTGITVRNLLGLLQFVSGGTIQVFKPSDFAGPLSNTAAVLPLGRTLAQTLLLSLHRPEPDDLPAWERDPPRIAQLKAAPTLPTGRNDRYTRQTRAVLLHPEGEAGTLIRWIRYGAGLALSKETKIPEPMAAFRQDSKERRPLNFNEGRSLWRDLPSIVPDPERTGFHPRILDDAYSLYQELDEVDMKFSLMVAGLTVMPGKADKIIRWRAESVLLPRKVLEANSSASNMLRALFEKAEKSGNQLKGLAEDLLCLACRINKKKKQDWKKLQKMSKALPTLPVYYASLEGQVPKLLDLIAEDDADAASEHWAKARLDAARKAWKATCTALGNSIAVIRAIAKVEPGFGRLVNGLKAEITPATQKEDAA